MKNIINIDKSISIPIKLVTEKEEDRENNKKWSFSFVYYFTEIRDIYLMLKNFLEIENDFGKSKSFLGAFAEYCRKKELPYVKKKWSDRKVLEVLNALKNFGLINNIDNSIKKNVFQDVNIGDKNISSKDYAVFKEIYFSYFRFKEIFSWFIDPSIVNKKDFVDNLKEDEIINNSNVLFTFSNISRFTDSFITELKNDTPIYSLNKDQLDVARFWDVFIKWGTELELIEKYSLAQIDIKTSTTKNISCVSILTNNTIKLDLYEYLITNYRESYIHIPDLVLRLICEYRIKLKSIHEFIINSYIANKEKFTLDRTSEIFIKKSEIKENEKILYPIYINSYISHIKVRK
ncbi:MAG: hypothetical protein V1773_18035 [bacterium]